jgi:DNA-binding LacI/PurR family transcriptional regulator
VAQQKRATLSDIARQVGVSTGTVSVVLNNAHSGTNVADQTREAIREAARALGYRPNWVARALQGASTRTIGIIPTQAEQDFLLGPHVGRVLNAAANVLHAVNHDLLVITRCNQQNSDEILKAVVNGRMDGALIVAPIVDSRLVETLMEARFPIAVLDGDPSHLCAFNTDDAEGIRLSVEHLRSLGHERIASIAGPSTLRSGRLRLAAFRDLCGEEAPVAYGDFRIQGGEQALHELVRRDSHITAISCASDEMAIGALRAARQLGLNVPRDLSIVGFDDTNSAQLVQPALTTYAQPVEEMTRAAVTALLSEIETSSPVRGTNIPGRLIIRESTDRPTRDL